MRSLRRILFGFLSVIALAGCGETVARYGSYWDSHRYLSPINFMPANAPSMRNRFYQNPGEGDAMDREHLGIDIIAALGSPVLAPAPGTVRSVFFEPMYGNNIVIDHGTDAMGLRIQTSYKHLQSQTVQAGDVVTRGQQIGTLGRSGILSAGILHLHYMVLREGEHRSIKAVDPNDFWVDGAGRVACFDPTREYADVPFRTTYPVACR